MLVFYREKDTGIVFQPVSPCCPYTVSEIRRGRFLPTTNKLGKVILLDTSTDSEIKNCSYCGNSTQITNLEKEEE